MVRDLEEIAEKVKEHLRTSDTKVIDVRDLTKDQLEELKSNYLKECNLLIGNPYMSAKRNIKEKLYYIHVTNKIKKK